MAKGRGRPIVRFTFPDGSVADVPQAKVLRDQSRQLQGIADLEGDREPLEAFWERQALGDAQAQVATAARAKGGRERARRAGAQPEWLAALFALAYAQLEGEGTAKVGRDNLAGRAWTLGRRSLALPPDDLDKVTAHAARKYLDGLRHTGE